MGLHLAGGSTSLDLFCSAGGRFWPTSEADVCIAACWSGLILKRSSKALEAELLWQPKDNDNMRNEFVVSQSCSRVNAAKKA
jgi:hypothetical protein